MPAIKVMYTATAVPMIPDTRFRRAYSVSLSGLVRKPPAAAVTKEDKVAAHVSFVLLKIQKVVD